MQPASLTRFLNVVFKKFLIPNKLSGVNSAIRRNVLLHFGGFNENSWWSEDSELGWKLKRTGKVVYDPDNVVNTTYPDTWSDIWKRKFYWGYAMGLKFREQMPFNIKLWLRPMIFLVLFISLLTFFGDNTLWDKCVSCAWRNIFYFIKLIDDRICSIRCDRYSKEQKRTYVIKNAFPDGSLTYCAGICLCVRHVSWLL